MAPEHFIREKFKRVIWKGSWHAVVHERSAKRGRQDLVNEPQQRSGRRRGLVAATFKIFYLSLQKWLFYFSFHIMVPYKYMCNMHTYIHRNMQSHYFKFYETISMLCVIHFDMFCYVDVLVYSMLLKIPSKS